ncbi:Rv3235 family protein [Serinicoccus kebangsaanensis]|uniref:Rv3235 family protein n=1 Tax=Serinicoccus kebangsaanensis TaxID=2602069 RepID=UPI00124E965C|nr:Rv3235 family protein [Serinicoccus kebangsaanensis]
MSGRAASSPGVLHLTPVATHEPTADGTDWSSPGADGHATAPYVQGSLAVDFRAEAYDSYFGPQATGTQDLPEAQAWARRTLRALLEICAGNRPVEQLSRWLAPEVRERVARRSQLARRRGGRFGPPLVRAVLACHPADGVCEISAVVVLEGRVRALAMRISGVDGRWVITALELG